MNNSGERVHAGLLRPGSHEPEIELAQKLFKRLSGGSRRAIRPLSTVINVTRPYVSRHSPSSQIGCRSGHRALLGDSTRMRPRPGRVFAAIRRTGLRGERLPEPMGGGRGRLSTAYWLWGVLECRSAEISNGFDGSCGLAQTGDWRRPLGRHPRRVAIKTGGYVASA